MKNQSGTSFEFDVLVIGSGLAGMHYALQILNLQPNLRIALVCKAQAVEGNSRYAQGGIAAVAQAPDSLEQHIKDTLIAGDGLSYQPHVECIIHQGPQAIQDLIDYQVPFSKTADGQYSLAQEGGHSQRRIYNCGDHTGESIIQKIYERITQHPQIRVFENHLAVNLIVQTPPYRIDIPGEVLGAYILDEKTLKIHTLLANIVVLATGGSGKVYRYTSNPTIATGDGVAMAYRAGARITNMEFYQFHPTLLHHPKRNDFLISEAVRGEGGLLRNADTLERFMTKYEPNRLELATRDIVSRAIFTEIENSQKPFVYLDTTHLSKAFLKKHFPQIFETLSSIGLDMSQDMIPVVPGAHYQCGGVMTDIDGRTDIKRLFAIGEVACTGLHGANRLASNSLLEAVVMARNAAHASIRDAMKPVKNRQQIPAWKSPTDFNTRRASQINSHWKSLRNEMTAYAGIIRTQEGLDDLLQMVKIRRKIIENYYWNHLITTDLIELRNIICVAELIVRSALARKESRGAHFREDFPNQLKEAKNSMDRMMYPENRFI
ncbi:MAG TPA: L-aspartate oxidase [Legionellales bacterium]|nr:L-aspartate oxidase [Legionellales bacterium]